MLQNGTKGIQVLAWMGGKGDQLKIVQKTKIWLYWQMVYAHTRICATKCTKFSSILRNKWINQS